MTETPPTYNGRVISPIRQVLREIDEYFAIIPESLIKSGQPSAIAIYGILDRVASDRNNNQCFRSLKDLASDTKLSVPTIRRALDYLIEHNYIQRVTRGDGRLASVFFLPFQLRGKENYTQGEKFDTPGVSQISTKQRLETKTSSSANASELVNKIVKNAREEKQLIESREMWPEWYSLLFGIPGFKTPYDQVNKWRLGKGISDELAEEQAYGLRDWWPRRPRARQGGDPYATFQNWCNKALKGNKEQRNGNNKPQVKAGPEVGTTFAELLGN